MERQTWNDLTKFRLAARKVSATAEAESKALAAFEQSPDAESAAALHQAHHEELNAVQQMIACLDLLERRNPEMSAP